MSNKNREREMRRPRNEQSAENLQNEMSDSRSEHMADWFQEDISRRSASKRIGKGLILASVLGASGLTAYQLISDSDTEVDKDSLELQKQSGWNVGSTDKPLNFGLASAVDSQGRTDWQQYLMPDKLVGVYQPAAAQWQPFYTPTLIQSLSQPGLREQMKLMQTPEMQSMYGQAGGLRELLSQAQNAGQTLMISDLEGPLSVALGAALADTAHLIPDFDNWPHPLGVVRSHETIAAMAFYAGEVEQKKAKLKAESPALVLLDRQRLSEYKDADNQFDNRYLAKLPPPDQLKQRGIANLLYVMKDESQREELDDLNEDFVEYQKQGINLQILRMSDFKPVTEQVQTTQPNGAPVTNTETHYYYRGSPFFHWWFYDHYFYRPYSTVYVYRGGRSTPLARPSMSAPPIPAYRPVSRPTIFSGTRVGGYGQGIGRTRPSGFGRTSVRMSSDGRVTGTRAGRSGSFGRSSGWFGG
jgi:hypothetical protein